jgi:hypothetical protein
MKSITRLSLALIMFSLFSISYLVTSVSAQQGYQFRYITHNGRAEAPSPAELRARGINEQERICLDGNHAVVPCRTPPGMPPTGNHEVEPGTNTPGEGRQWENGRVQPIGVHEVCYMVSPLTCKPDELHGEDRSNGVDTVYAVCEGLKDACRQLGYVRRTIPECGEQDTREGCAD